MLDFNPSAFKRGKTARLILDTIDAALAKRMKEKAEDRANYKSKGNFGMGAGIVGAPCKRKTQYDYLGTMPDADHEYNPRMQRIWDRGHMGEELAAGWIREAGYDLRTTNAKGRQFGFRVANGKFKGYYDGIIYSGPGIEGPTLWENKWLGDKAYRQVEQHGVEKAKPEYFAQVQTYMAYEDLTEFPTVWTAINADTCEINVELIPFKKNKAQQATDTAVSLIQDSEAGAMRPRVSADPEYWLCKGCEYRRHCHGNT